MLQTDEMVSTPAPEADLRSALEEGLALRGGAARRVVRLERRPSEYRSSFELELLTAVLDDGATLHLVFKDLSWGRLLEGGRRVKPKFLYDPRREIETYRRILGPRAVSSPTCYAAVTDARAGRHWLFLEQVEGVELYQVGDFEMWKEVARWLAGVHARFETEASVLHEEVPLLRYEEAFYRLWLGRAQEFLSDGPERVRRELELITRGYERLIERLLALPATFLHGEFYASNVLVRETQEGVRVCPVDWEMAATGPGLIDLAALVAGEWSEAQRIELAAAYYEASTDGGGPRASFEDFLAALDCCRLFNAVQWVGCFGRRGQLRRHARDWLDEAARLCEKLRLAV